MQAATIQHTSTRPGGPAPTRMSSPAVCAGAPVSRQPWPVPPGLLLADEPTTALDVTVLDLLGRHRETRGPAALLITHDIGLLHGRARRVAVVYGGRIVETGPTEAVTERPAHPYTAALLRSVPRVTGPLT